MIRTGVPGRAFMARPVRVLPVKLMTGTSGASTKYSSPSRPPVRTLTTPGGRPSVSEITSIRYAPKSASRRCVPR